MQQHEMRQMSYDTEVGRVTVVHRVLDIRRPIWSLGSIMDSGCDGYFTKDWIVKNNGMELDMILSGGVFFVTANPSKLSSRKRSAAELDSMSPAEVEQVTLTRVHAKFGVRGPATRDVGWRRTVSACQNSHGPGDTLSCGKNIAQGFGTRPPSQMVSMVCSSASSG